MDSDALMVTLLVSVLWPLGAVVLLAFAGPGAYWAMVAIGAAVVALFAGAPAAFGPVAVGAYLYAVREKGRCRFQALCRLVGSMVGRGRKTAENPHET